MKNKNQNKTERQTPIRDGDSRPDQNIEGKTNVERERKKTSSPLASDKSKLTREGAADTNSMEDYKDAKP